MKALVIGATGATGRDLVDVLLKDSFYKEVVVFVRRSTEIIHPKLKEIITDFDHPELIADSINGDVLFSCLGTTLKAAGSKENQRRIDYEIPLQFAEIARQNSVPKVVLLSSYGADANSRVFYSQLKGALEEAIEDFKFESLIIFRPGLLLRKETDRLGEKISAGLLNFLNKLGIAKKFKPMPTALLAKKMVKASKNLSRGKQLIALEKIFELG